MERSRNRQTRSTGGSTFLCRSALSYRGSFAYGGGRGRIGEGAHRANGAALVFGVKADRDPHPVQRS